MPKLTKGERIALENDLNRAFNEYKEEWIYNGPLTEKARLWATHIDITLKALGVVNNMQHIPTTVKLSFNEMRALIVAVGLSSQHFEMVSYFPKMLWANFAGDASGPPRDEANFIPSTLLADLVYEGLHGQFFDIRAFGRTLKPGELEHPHFEAYLPIYPAEGTIFDLASKFGELSERYRLDNDPATFGKRQRTPV